MLLLAAPLLAAARRCTAGLCLIAWCACVAIAVQRPSIRGVCCRARSVVECGTARGHLRSIARPWNSRGSCSAAPRLHCCSSFAACRETHDLVFVHLLQLSPQGWHVLACQQQQACCMSAPTRLPPIISLPPRSLRRCCNSLGGARADGHMICRLPAPRVRYLRITCARSRRWLSSPVPPPASPRLLGQTAPPVSGRQGRQWQRQPRQRGCRRSAVPAWAPAAAEALVAADYRSRCRCSCALTRPPCPAAAGNCARSSWGQRLSPLRRGELRGDGSAVVLVQCSPEHWLTSTKQTAAYIPQMVMGARGWCT